MVQLRVNQGCLVLGEGQPTSPTGQPSKLYMHTAKSSRGQCSWTTIPRRTGPMRASRARSCRQEWAGSKIVVTRRRSTCSKLRASTPGQHQAGQRYCSREGDGLNMGQMWLKGRSSVGQLLVNHCSIAGRPGVGSPGAGSAPLGQQTQCYL